MKVLTEKKLKLILICFFVVFSLGIGVVREVNAAYWYANSNCKNDGNGTAATCASSPGGVGARKVLYDTINGLKVTAGDIIIAVDGTYSVFGSESYAIGWISKTGTAQNRLTIKAQNRGGAIVNCGNKTTKNGFQFGSNISYVTIEGFDIQNCFVGIHSNNNDDNIILKNNVIHNVAQGFYNGGTCDNNIFDGNLVYDFGTPGTNQDHGIYMRGINGTIINNIVYNNLGNGWHIQVGTEAGNPGEVSGNWLIANNTFVGTTTSGTQASQIRIYGVTNFTSMDVKNNISYGTNVLLYLGSGAATSAYDFSNNLTYNNSNYVCGDTLTGHCPKATFSENITGDPLFLKVSSGNFRPSSGSPAIDKGTALSIVPNDYDGNKRPGGLKYDIGAFEYYSVESYVVLPNPPMMID